MNNTKFQQHLNKDKEEHIVEYLNLNLPKLTFLKRINKKANKKSPKIRRI